MQVIHTCTICVMLLIYLTDGYGTLENTYATIEFCEAREQFAHFYLRKYTVYRIAVYAMGQLLLGQVLNLSQYQLTVIVKPM